MNTITASRKSTLPQYAGQTITSNLSCVQGSAKRNANRSMYRWGHFLLPTEAGGWALLLASQLFWAWYMARVFYG